MSLIYRDEKGRKIQHLYWNANMSNVVIVAKEGDREDWCAYIGGRPGYVSEQAAVGHVLRAGDKIDQKLAEFIFPDFVALGLEYRP